jgi:hypothetical protein
LAYQGIGPYVVQNKLEPNKNKKTTQHGKYLLQYFFFEDDQNNVAFWNSMEGFFLLTNVMERYERKSTIVTNIGGHQFQSYVTNYNITFSFFNPCPIDNFL